jgi:hypothetical protein
VRSRMVQSRKDTDQIFVAKVRKFRDFYSRETVGYVNGYPARQIILIRRAF